MQHRNVHLSLLFLLAFAGACDEVIVEPLPPLAKVRIVNAADIADVRVRLAGSSTFLAEDLDFREVTESCIDVLPGEQSFVFTSVDIELTTAVATLEANKSYTAFLVASGPTRRAVILSDEVTPLTADNAIRLINGTTAAGDVYVTPPGGAVGAGFLAAGNMGVLATSNAMPSYVHRPAAHTQVRLFNVGTTTNPRADLTITLPSSRVGTVVFTNLGMPEGPTAFFVTPCP
jgi:hypothetical protein